MQPVTLPMLAFLGAAEIEKTPHALVPHRLPAPARAQAHDTAVHLVEQMPAGVRIVLRTDATAIELDVDLEILVPAGKEPLPAVFDLIVDGQLVESVSTVDGSRLTITPSGEIVRTPGSTTTVRLDRLPGDLAKRVELWLPHAATVQIRAVRGTPAAIVQAAEATGPRWIHYGSSISHCLEAPGPSRTWPGRVALQAGWELTHLGFAGQCMLDPFVARTIRDTAADVITLKVGMNVHNGDTYRERTFVPTLHGFLDTIRDGHRTTPLVLITPTWFAAGEHAPGPAVRTADGSIGTAPRSAELSGGALTLSRIRELIELVASNRHDPNLHHVDGRDLMGESDAQNLYDGLHPTADGYLRIAERFFALVCQRLHLAPQQNRP